MSQKTTDGLAACIRVFNRATGIGLRAKSLFAAVLWILAVPLATQSQEKFSFSLAPKVLKDGSITDISLGYHYTPKSTGNVRLRFSNTAKNEQFDETVPDSINAVKDETFALFLTPFEFAFFNRPGVQLKAGGGLYYEYYASTEKGFFNMPALETLGKERVNSFSNDFTTHSVGPTITLGFNYQSEWFRAVVNGGVVPIFYLSAHQDMKITPLMDPRSADYSQETSGGPYFYADLTVTLFKYASLALLYDYSTLDYQVIDFDDQFKWFTPESKTISQSLKLEVCAFIPLGGNVYAQIGYGHSFDSIQVNSAPLVESGRDYVILAMILTVLALAACPPGGVVEGGNETYPKELWGEWLRMDTGDKWYITDDALKINSADASMSATLTKQSDRVIEVTDQGRKYYLYASRVATASFTGTIVGAEGSGRAISGGLGGIRVSIENLNNKANDLTADTDAEGKFTAEGVILGDAYKLTPQGGTSVTVIPTSDGGDIGVVTITRGVNFKTSLISTQSSTDLTELYMSEAYQFEIEFENTGDEDCPAPSYTITEPSGVSITGTLQGILGTIEPGMKKKVPIGVRCSALASDHEYKKINIRIVDGTGKTWDDSVSLRFYKESMDFTIKAEKPVSGILISPDSKTYSFTNVTNGSVAVPRRTSGDYLVVFSGATIETETSYALGIGVEAEGDFSTFFDTGRYEPNNTEGAAVSLNAQKVTAYLYKNDIDYYRISYGNVNFPSNPTNVSAPTNVTASIADAQVTLSWNAVTGARSYNIYRSNSQTGTYTEVGTSTSSSYTETVTTRGTYYYKVSAVAANSVESAYSTPTAVAVTTLPVEIDVTNLSDTLSWLSVNAVRLTHYTLSLTRNETIQPQTFSYAGTDITITLKGKGGERIVSLSGNGSLFTVAGGVTLVLDDRVTLKGHSSNNDSLVRVNSGGNLVLKDGAKISGNTASSFGGGVYVSSGPFTKQLGGIIYGSNADSTLKNTAGSNGHAVYVSSVQKRNTTAGVGVTLDSTVSGSAGGWE